MSNYSHVAVIPARKNSKGFPKKIEYITKELPNF